MKRCPASREEVAYTGRSAEKWLQVLLRFNGVLAVGAIVPVMMPHSWLVWCIDKVEPDMPVRLLASYLARTLSAFYLLLGILLLLLATDVRRYRRPIQVMMLWTLFAATSLLLHVGTYLREFQHSWFFWAVFGDGVYGLVTVVAILFLQRRVARADDHASSG